MITHSPARLPGALARPRCAVVRAQQKGFGGGEGSSGSKQQGGKVGKRGKVASRPSPEKQIAQLQAEEAAFQARLDASAAAPARLHQPGSQPSARAGGGDDDDDGDEVEVPEEITDRMLRRMVTFAGIPVLLGILLLPGFYYLKKVQDLDVPVWAVYIVQTAAFGGGLAGITYGILSTSWDTRREGTKLGWAEFQANLPLLLDRFRANKD